MKNLSSRTYYGLILILMLLLIFLGIKQFQWLEEVSNNQRRQLEESIVASVQNITSDFDNTINELNEMFSYIDGNDEKSILLEIHERMEQSESPSLKFIDSILVRNKQTQRMLFYNHEQSEAYLLNKSVLQYWNKKLTTTKRSQGLGLEPFIGSKSRLILDQPSFLRIQCAPENIDIRAGRANAFLFQHYSNSIVNDKYEIIIKMNQENLVQFMSALVQTYLGSNATNIYDWDISDNQSDEIVSSLFTSNKKVLRDSADASASMGTLSQKSVIIIRTDSDKFPFKLEEKVEISVEDNELKLNSNQKIRSESQTVVGYSFFSSDSTITSTFSSSTTKNGANSSAAITQSNSNFVFNSNDFDTNQLVNLKEKDLAPYAFNVRFKAGSLDAYIRSNQIKNASLNFGILGILALSLVLIAWNAKRLESTSKQQMEFVAGVSHELKTPLAVIRSAAENVSDGIVTDPEQLKKYGHLIQDEGKRLSDMVAQILEFSGIQSDNINVNIQEVSTSEILEDIHQDALKITKQANFELNWFVAPQLENVVADPKLLKSSFLNLLTNAIKYSDKDKEVTVRIFQRYVNKQSYLHLAVEDEGMGIPNKDLAKVFEPFYRTDRVRSDQIRGNGLGLHLVKKWMKFQGGEVNVESEEGIGSTFTLLFKTA